MATFPSSVKSFATLIDLVDSVLASHQNERADEITALEDYLLNTFTGPDGFSTGHLISPSVSSNNLSLAILRPDGSTPSATTPIRFRVGGSMYSLSSALSFTKNSGTNWMNAGSSNLIGGNPLDLFVYAIAETGAAAGLKFGYSRLPHAYTMGDFVNTTTSEKYIAGNWTNFNSSDKVEVIGRFRAQLSVTTFNWSIPSSLVISRPIWETEWLDYSPQATGFSAQPTNTVYRYRVDKSQVTLFARHQTAGTSDATGFTIPLPFTAKIITFMAWGSAGVVQDAGVIQTTPGVMRILSGATVMDVFKNFSTTFTASGNKALLQMSPIVYEI